MHCIVRILLTSAALGALSPFAGAALAWGDDLSHTGLAYLWFFSWPSAIESALFHEESTDYAVMALAYAVQYAALLLVVYALPVIVMSLVHKWKALHRQAAAGARAQRRNRLLHH
jgi:hypothetical protein